MPARKKPAAANRAPTLIQAGAHEAGVIKFYGYQDEDIVSPWRMMMSMQARQTGKTFGISAEMLLTCALTQRARCVTLSASLRQGALNIQKDAEVWRTVTGLMRRRVGQDSELPDKDRKLITSPADDDKGRLIDLDAISDLLEHGKLETKMFWSNAADNYSSHQIFAANPDTARGATADFLAWDEFGTTPEFREVLRAVKHMISRRPKARFKIKGTPPLSPDHESWEITYDETAYTPNPRGNWRKSNAPGGQAMPILRVDAYDAELAGIQYYNDVTGEKCSVADYIEASTDKEGDGRELLLLFNNSGNVLIPYSCLVRAQRDPSGGGDVFDLGAISDLNSLSAEGLRTELRKRVPADWTRHCTPGDEIAFGHDQSTSDKAGESNPSTLVVTQDAGIFRHMRLCVSWLSRFPQVNEALMWLIIGDAMRANLRLRGFGVDASNEWHNAQRIAELFGHVVSVTLFKDGEKHPLGKTNWKNHLADQYARKHTDGLYTLPANGSAAAVDGLLTDHSLAVKGPTGVEFRTSKGMHFDTGAAAMLAEEILTAGSGPLEIARACSSAMHEQRGDLDDDDGWEIPAPHETTHAF
jgi:hypothetical protein